jgi:peptide/nickel transport system substrate-binding protein
MAKKIVWLVVSCIMILSLVVASCGKEGNEGTDITYEPVDSSGPLTNVEKNTEKPQYGGKITILNNTGFDTWNPGATVGRSAAQDGLMIEAILTADHEAGPAGSGETNYISNISDFKYVAGMLAESWETPEIGVWILNIRQGVHFTNHEDFEASEFVGGREMTAEDVAYSIEWMRDTPTSITAISEPSLISNTTVERTGEWQITVRTPVSPTTGYLWIMGGGAGQSVWPKEWLDEYAASNEWRDVVGTGPYMIDDYIDGSAAKYIRNPNYWGVNPVGPGKGDKLPYADEVTWQIVPDYSTRLAALRTGQAENSFADILTKEDFETIIESNPEIKYAQMIIDPIQISGRVDLADNPFSKKEVRQAMMLAIDHPSIVADLYGGQAELLDSPARKWYESIYVPMEELPETVQELYGYNPEKAKDLLSQAGYPDGFKMTMVLQNTPAHEEAGSLIKSYFDQVGIDLTLQVVEPTIFTGMWIGREVEDLMLSQFPGGNGALFVRYSFGFFRGPNFFNMSHVNDPVGTDPVIENAYNIQSENVMINYPAADKAFRDTVPYILENAFLIPLPAPYGYRVWQPWLKDYYGEYYTKWWLQYAWVDQELKASLGR